MARILIVDDEEMDRVLIRSLLGTAGHHLLFAADGQAALDLCHETDVDLVITDLAMPGFGGLRFIKELRDAHFDMPVIAMSGRAADQLDLAQNYGANFTLFKPIDGEKLLESVRKSLAKKRPPPSWIPEGKLEDEWPGS